MAARRIAKEHRDLVAQHAKWLSVEFTPDAAAPGGQDVFRWICWIVPSGGLMEGMRVEVHVKLPRDYPFKVNAKHSRPPSATYMSSIPHPAWKKGDSLGGCCGGGEWSPAHTIVPWLLLPALLLMDCPISKQMMMGKYGGSAREVERSFVVADWVRRLRNFEPEDPQRMLQKRSPEQQLEWIQVTRPALMTELTVHDALLPDLSSIIVGYLDDGANRHAQSEAQLCADTRAYVQKMTECVRRQSEQEEQERRAIEAANAKAAEAAAANAASNSAQPSVHVTVRTLTGKQIPLQVSPESSVFDLKLTMHRVEGIPVDQQRIICSGTQPGDEQTIQSMVERQSRAAAQPAAGPQPAGAGSSSSAASASSAAAAAVGSSAAHPLLIHLVLRLRCSCFNMREIQPFRARRRQAAAEGSAAAAASSVAASSSSAASARSSAVVAASTLEFVPCAWKEFAGVWCDDREPSAAEGSGSQN